MLESFFTRVFITFVVLHIGVPSSATALPPFHHQEQPEKHAIQEPDIFLLGLPHTGTEVLLSTLSSLGYRHNEPFDDDEEVHHFSSLQDATAITSQHPYAEVFSGTPWSLTYADLAPLFPDAKFILTLRESEDVWIRDLKQGCNNKQPGFKEQMSEEAYRDEYRRHAESVRQFFASSEDVAAVASSSFMELVVDRNGPLRIAQVRQLCSFLAVECDPTTLLSATASHHSGRLRKYFKSLNAGLLQWKTLREWVTGVLKEWLNMLGWLTAHNI